MLCKMSCTYPKAKSFMFVTPKEDHCDMANSGRKN